MPPSKVTTLPRKAAFEYIRSQYPSMTREEQLELKDELNKHYAWELIDLVSLLHEFRKDMEPLTSSPGSEPKKESCPRSVVDLTRYSLPWIGGCQHMVGGTWENIPSEWRHIRWRQEIDGVVGRTYPPPVRIPGEEIWSAKDVYTAIARVKHRIEAVRTAKLQSQKEQA